MAAVPFVGTVIIRRGDGTMDSVQIACDDVAGNFALFGDAAIADYQCPTGGMVSDIVFQRAAPPYVTGNLVVFVNDKPVGYTIAADVNLAGQNFRQVQSAPFGIRPGSRLRLQEIV